MMGFGRIPRQAIDRAIANARDLPPEIPLTSIHRSIAYTGGGRAPARRPASTKIECFTRDPTAAIGVGFLPFAMPASLIHDHERR